MGIVKFAFVVALIAVSTYFCCFREKTFNQDFFKDKRVAITGASSGIGESMAYQYAKFGAKLILTARRENLLEKVKAKCKELGAKQVDIIAADMGKSADRIKFVEFITKTFGGLDQLILNHAFMPIGIWDPEQTLAETQKTMNINFFAFVEIATSLIPVLAKSHGSIGVVSSVAGKVSHAKSSSYSASKFAMQGYFGSLQRDLKVKKIDVSITLAVLGLIETDTARKNVETFGQGKGGVDLMSMAADADETAIAIIKGVTNRENEIVYPLLAKVIVVLYKISPCFTEFLESFTFDVDS